MNERRAHNDNNNLISIIITVHYLVILHVHLAVQQLLSSLITPLITKLIASATPPVQPDESARLNLHQDRDVNSEQVRKCRENGHIFRR